MPDNSRATKGGQLTRYQQANDLPNRYHAAAGPLFAFKSESEVTMTEVNQKMASALMESILAAFRTETADLERLAEEVDAAGQDVEKIHAAIERYAKKRTRAMETIHSMLQADAAEFRRGLGR